MAELKLIIFSLTLPLLLLLFAFIYKGKRVFARLCFVLGFLWIYLPSTPLVAYALAEYWQTIPAFDNSQAAEIQSVAAIVILSGAYNRNIVEYPANRTISTSTLARLRYGAEVAKVQNLPVLTTGGVLGLAQGVPLADQMAETLIQEFTIPVAWRERQSLTTAENAEFSAQILTEHNIDTVILVTDAIHMHRAILAFEHYGMTVIPAPTKFESSHIQTFIFRLIPRASSFVLSKKILHEILGCWVYKLYTLK